MRKWHAQALTLAGVALFLVGMYFIWMIFEMTRVINSGENPPSWWVIFTVPYCDLSQCEITHTLAWNVMAVVMSAGVLMIVTGTLMYNKVTRKYA